MGALSGTGPFTVFAPTNEAFAKIPAATLARLLEPANIKKLDALLEYHVIAGAAIFAKDLKPTQEVKTLEGEELKIVVNAGRDCQQEHSDGGGQCCLQRRGAYHRWS